MKDLLGLNEPIETMPEWMAPLYVHKILAEVVAAGKTAWVGECDCPLGTVHITDKGTNKIQCDCGKFLRPFPISTEEDIEMFEQGMFRERGLLC